MRAGRGVVLTDEGLPLASGARVARELRVGLETELAVERRLDLALVAARAGEQRAAELGLDEELRVEELGGGVEGRSGDGRVDVVGSRDGVRSQERDDLGGGEASGVRETGEDAVDSVERFRNGQIGRGLGGIGAAEKHCETGGTGAVGHTNGTSKLDARRKGGG